MSNEPTLKMTDLDYLTAAPHLQMIKAALPYVQLPEQRIFSLLVKISELNRTVKLFEKKEEGEIGICSLEADAPSSPVDMLNAMKPFGTEDEQDFIDLIINFLQGSRLYQSYRDSMEASGQETSEKQPEPEGRREPEEQREAGEQREAARDSEESGPSRKGNFRSFPMEQLINILPQEQQSKLETAQMLMQTFQQFS